MSIQINNDGIADIFKRAQDIKNSLASSINNEEVIASKQMDVIKHKQVAEIKPGHIGLSGIKIRENGTLTKDAFMAKLAPQYDRYPDLQLSEEELLRVKNTMLSFTAGVNAAVPLTCTANSCAFKNTCPFFQINKAPLGRPCLVESQLIEYWTAEYLNEFNVDPNKLTEMHMVSELAELNIYEMRITKYIAENHQTLLQEVVTGIDTAGNIITNLDISKSFDLKERIKKQRMKVLEALMATRKENIKIAVQVASTNTTANKIADLKQQLEKLSNDIKNTKVIDGEYESLS